MAAATMSTCGWIEECRVPRSAVDFSPSRGYQPTVAKICHKIGIFGAKNARTCDPRERNNVCVIRSAVVTNFRNFGCDVAGVSKDRPTGPAPFFQEPHRRADAAELGRKLATIDQAPFLT